MSLLEGRGGEMIKDSYRPTVLGGSDSIKPKTLFHAISEIERWSYTEREAGNLPESIVTQPVYWSFMAVGGANTFITSMIMFLTLPLSIGVISEVLPIFGTKTPGFFDKVIALIMSVGPSIVTALFITLLFWNLFLGKATKKAVNSLVIQGIVLSQVLFTFFAVFLYLGISEVILSGKNCISMSATLSNWSAQFLKNPIPPETFLAFLLKAKKVIVKSSFVFIIIALLKVTILLAGYVRAYRKTKKFIELYIQYFPDKDKFLEVA